MSKLTTEQLAALEVGQQVGVADVNCWGDVYGQGLYRVVGKNKVRIVVQHEGDGWERSFSAKKGTELVGPCEKYRIPYLEPAESQIERIERFAYLKSLREGWRQCEQYARDRDIAHLKKAVADLEALLLLEK